MRFDLDQYVATAWLLRFIGMAFVRVVAAKFFYSQNYFIEGKAPRTGVASICVTCNGWV